VWWDLVTDKDFVRGLTNNLWVNNNRDIQLPLYVKQRRRAPFLFVKTEVLLLSSTSQPNHSLLFPQNIRSCLPSVIRRLPPHSVPHLTPEVEDLVKSSLLPSNYPCRKWFILWVLQSIATVVFTTAADIKMTMRIYLSLWDSCARALLKLFN